MEVPLRWNGTVWVISSSIIVVVMLCLPSVCLGIRSFTGTGLEFHKQLRFSEAPEYRNGVDCPTSSTSSSSSSSPCDPSSLIHIAMTLDYEYLRGSIAAVHSVLKHASCPESIFFHFISAEFDSLSPRVLSQLVRSTFPSLTFKVYIFDSSSVIKLISSSVRNALQNPLNYARIYLGDTLDTCVTRVIYLDSDVVLVDDVYKLWNIQLSPDRVIGAPEYCHANFTSYFTRAFWSDQTLAQTFNGRVRTPCYFNTGVMVMDLSQWRGQSLRLQLEKWMEIQKKKRIYELGSQPPFMLVFGGNVEPIDHRWNQHGLGGDNVMGSCRSLHPGPVSLLHWSGKGKPWVRLDGGQPCPVDYLWKPYDLFTRSRGNDMV